jgi:methyl-accepting chemotaxis protein
MKWLIALIQRPRIQLRWKLLGGFVAANLLLIVALGLAVFSLFSTSDRLNSLKTSNSRFQQVAQIELLKSRLVNRALDYSLSENLALLKDYDVIHSSLDQSLATFKPDAVEQDNYKTLVQEVATLGQLLDQMVRLGTANERDKAEEIWRSEGSKQSMTVNSLTTELNNQESHQAEATYEQGEATITTTTWGISGLALLAVVVAVALALLLTSALTEPVRQLRTRLASLAAGDLTQPMQVANGDELGELGHTYNSTLGALHQLISQLYAQSQQVNSATTELNAQVKNQVAGSSQQAEAITEATQCLQELSQTANEIARQALLVSEAVTFSLKQTQEVNNLADQMVVAHEEGRATLVRTVHALENLKEQVRNIEAQQQALVSQTAAIQGVIELIDSIAKETHLLALNASIEAASAGEYGERFSVIAQEVKKLADRSVKATKQVRGALGGIALAVGRVSQSAANGLTEAEKAVRDSAVSNQVLVNMASLTEQVREAVQEIVVQAKDSAKLASIIGVVTRQQQSSSNIMLEKMLEIEIVTAQTLTVVKQGEIVTYQLRASAQELEQSADALRLVA